MPNNTKISYKSTTIACYIGLFVQAIVINLTPILFIPLREQFGLSFQQLGFLVLINFITQVACDILFSGIVDKYGYRSFAAVSHLLTIVGFIIFAISPFIMDKPYIGFVIGTIVFSGSGGLLELLLSPIINSIPTDEKATAMSVLHSFYAWGQVAVVLLTTVSLFIFGTKAWQLIMLIWIIVPLFNFILFLKVPLAPPIPEEHRQGMRMLIFKPFFIICFLAIGFGGAAEVSMNQWTSAFMDRAMDLPKIIGDTGGMCMFAIMLGLGRLLYGIYGSKINLLKIMFIGTLAASCCYIIVAFSFINLLSLAACAICGIAVSLLWPGTLVIASKKFPLAGAWLFAILAAGGDIGASVGPWMLGVVTEQSPKVPFISNLAIQFSLSSDQIGLRIGMFIAALFPIGAFICILAMSRLKATDLT